MVITAHQQFIAIPIWQGFRVLGPGQMPIGTVFGPGTLTIELRGPRFVRAPETPLTAEQLDAWIESQVQAGSSLLKYTSSN